MNKRKTVIAGIFALGFLIAFVVYTNFFVEPQTALEYRRPSPSEVVRQYFVSWNAKDYPNMYASLSDGFKKIEASAGDLASFKEYAESQNIREIAIASVQEKSNDGTTAVVEYAVEFLLSTGKRQRFDGLFTLKYRQGDIIQGWKLVHPYGDKIDTT